MTIVTPAAAQTVPGEQPGERGEGHVDTGAAASHAGEAPSGTAQAAEVRDGTHVRAFVQTLNDNDAITGRYVGDQSSRFIPTSSR